MRAGEAKGTFCFSGGHGNNLRRSACSYSDSGTYAYALAGGIGTVAGTIQDGGHRGASSYDNNREHMRYDEYLAAGYPIATGVIEGACHHFVKDRMEGAGMRWELEGAQAMQSLRAIYLNGQWDDFIAYRIAKEQASLYGETAQTTLAGTGKGVGCLCFVKDFAWPSSWAGPGNEVLNPGTASVPCAATGG